MKFYFLRETIADNIYIFQYTKQDNWNPSKCHCIISIQILVPKSAKRYVKVPLNKLEKALPGVSNKNLKFVIE